MIRVNECPVCESDQRQEVWNENFGVELYKVSQCTDCDLLYTSMQTKDFNEGYKEFDSSTFNAKYGDIAAEKRLHDRHENYLEEVSIITSFKNGGRYLDIGCNAGWLLGYLKKMTTFELYGLEPSPFLANYTADRLGVKVFNNYLKPNILPDNEFDFISMTDVFEHIRSPNQVLPLIHAALKQDGYLMIKVPNGNFSLLKKWFLKLPLLNKCIEQQDIFDAKEHLIHYTQKSLKRILKQFNLEPIKFIVPKPIQTRGSRKITFILRSTVYWLSRLGLIPPQDLMIIGRKESPS